MSFIGAEELIKEHGFVMKVQKKLCGPTMKPKLQLYSLELLSNSERKNRKAIRSQFDELLLRHASSSGVKVFEGLRVTEITFSGERPISAIYEAHCSEPKEISFKYLVDASGRAGIMSTKYLKNRRFTKSLMNIAHWGYWKGGGRYAPGTTRENAPWFEAFTGKPVWISSMYVLTRGYVDETGWAWYIPLHDGTTSVGVVITKQSHAEKRAKASNGVDDPIMKLYMNQLAQAPKLMQFLAQAKLTSEIKSAGDYSYSASNYAGPGYRIAGDAGGVSPAQVQISGAADVDPRLTPQELEETLDFCKRIPVPSQSQAYKEVEERISDTAVLDGPIPCHSTVSAIVGDDESAKHVIFEITARKMFNIMLAHFRSEIFHGYYINLVRGELGMREC
ncbi:hypothetical protein C0992_011815 [Termitomyces sp. T32_za158]|nr:hypothetical protein C0992_011815 [Termitomyces sp. T32_za158]